MPSVFDTLDREWRQLASGRRAARRLADVLAVAGLDPLDSLADLERHVRSASPEDADQVLLALVTRAARQDDALAARVLLQLLLPGTRNLARRWWALGDHDERAAAAVAAVYRRIRTYPVERRPGRVAANILLDAARELRRAVPRLVATPTAEPIAPAAHAASAGTADNAAVELAEVLADAVAAGVIEHRDAQLIAQSRIAGRRIADIAVDHRLGTRALWDRRQRAERRLAAVGATAQVA
jgi:hypothetical protein